LVTDIGWCSKDFIPFEGFVVLRELDPRVIHERLDTIRRVYRLHLILHVDLAHMSTVKTVDLFR